MLTSFLESLLDAYTFCAKTAITKHPNHEENYHPRIKLLQNLCSIHYLVYFQKTYFNDSFDDTIVKRSKQTILRTDHDHKNYDELRIKSFWIEACDKFESHLVDRESW